MSPAPSSWRRVIGIVGGLGPHAHLQLEREILRAVDWAERDQDYPEWVLASLPQTPDRTAAVLGRGESPVPRLAEAVAAISRRADFAVIACVTAHAFLPELRQRIELPVLDIVEEALRSARAAGHRRVGVLATSGTLASGVFARAAGAVAGDLEVVSPLDLPDGEALQERLVMRPIYGGPAADGERPAATGAPAPAETPGTGSRVGGQGTAAAGSESGVGRGRPAALKTGGAEDPAQRARLAGILAEAVRRLADAGAETVVLGCTEIPLALGHEPLAGVPLIDPIREAARAAVEIAGGRRELPER